MIVLLWALSLFNAVAGAASGGLALRLMRGEERALWRSKTLLRIADAFAWVFPIAAIAGTALAWVDYKAGRQEAALMALIPIGWLLLMGLVFAIVDYAEDGVLGNARERGK
jgi:hypothetical protein